MNTIVYDARNGRLYSGDGVGAIVVWRRGSAGRGPDDYSVLRRVNRSRCYNLEGSLVRSFNRSE